MQGLLAWRAARQAAWTPSVRCAAHALPKPSEVQEDDTAVEDRVHSSQWASTSEPDEMESRWQSMQQSLQEGAQSRFESLQGPELGLKDFSNPHRKSSRPERDNAALQSHGEKALLDWREALKEAQQLKQSSSLRENALTDTFGREHTYLRISLTEKCNLRCLYCMPEEGVPLSPGSHMLTSDEIVYLTSLFASAGIQKIRLTGGEPTLRKDLVELTGRLHNVPGIKQIGITSNGIVLNRSLEELQANGLSLLNLSLDTLRPERFQQLTRRQGLSRVLATIDHAVDLGFDPVKVNVVLMRGVNEDEICDFVELTRERPINVRFIEYMPFDGNIWAEQKMVSYREMLDRVTAAYPAGLEPLQDPIGEVAKNFRVPGFVGSVSFITSMTKAFCSDCNRLRLMADGNLKVCLFGANEVSLRDALRGGASEEDLLAIISLGVNRKKAAHAGMQELSKSKNRAMVRIGG